MPCCAYGGTAGLCGLQVEGIKTLTTVYKQIQDSFAEQIVIYLQTAWRRHKAKKNARTVVDQVVQQGLLARTITPDPGFDAGIAADGDVSD